MIPRPPASTCGKALSAASAGIAASSRTRQNRNAVPVSSYAITKLCTGECFGLFTILHPFKLSYFPQLKLHDRRKERIDVIRVEGIHRFDIFVPEVIKPWQFLTVVGFCGCPRRPPLLVQRIQPSTG